MLKLSINLFEIDIYKYLKIMKAQKKVTFVIALLFLSIQVFGGWVITSETDEGTGSKELEKTYIQNNKIKTETQKDISIFNLETNHLYLLNPLNKTYWAGTLPEFKSEVIEGMKSKMESALANLPAEHQEMFRKKYQEMIDKVENEQSNTSKVFEMKQTEESITILDYRCEKYQFFKDETLTEDIWITPEIKINKELNIEKFKDFFTGFSNVADQSSAENTPEFFELLSQGYPMKSIKYHENFKISTTVVSIVSKQIPESVFTVPVGYSEVNIMDLWGD